MLHRFDTNYRVVNMSEKLYRIVHEILVIKKTCIWKLQSIKVDAYQDDIKITSSLMFHEKLNIECD